MPRWGYILDNMTKLTNLIQENDFGNVERDIAKKCAEYWYKVLRHAQATPPEKIRDSLQNFIEKEIKKTII